MASALGASRSFVSHALARVRSGVVSQGTGEGPPIHVEPFDATNVSTPAALIKLGTSIAAARRQRANFAAAQQDAELAREGTREQIALLRAQAKYYEGTGRQPAGRAPVPTLTQGPYKGMTADEARIAQGDKRIDISRTARADTAKRSGKVAAANAGLRQLDLSITHEAEQSATQSMGKWAPVLDRAATGDEAALRKINIDPADFKAAYGTQKGTMLEDARKQLHDNLVAMHRIGVSKRYESQRDLYNRVLEEGAGIDQAGAGDQGGQGDPLNAFYGQ